MMVDVLTAAAYWVHKEFPELILGTDIYLAPKIQWIKSGRQLEIQIVEAGVTYEMREGSNRAEDFVIVVGVLQRRPQDYGGKHARILSDLTSSLFKLREKIISALDLSYLPTINNTPLLTRPLYIFRESAVYENTTYPDLLIKEFHFAGGINYALV